VRPKNLDDVISLLAELVKIPSVCGEEHQIASYIHDWLTAKGLPAELVEVERNRPNVIVKLRASEPGPRIMLNGHMDTVPAGRGWRHDPFGSEIEYGRMYGRGTIDMKSGLACILWAVATCKSLGLPRRGELTFAAVVDEEAIDRGTYGLIRNGYATGLDFAMIPEATDLQVVTAHRGRVVFEVQVHGRAAHSHWPGRGVNAIEKAAVLISALPKLPNPKHPRLGECTLNTLKIEGGQEEVMLVPDQCRIIIDRCLVPGYGSKQALADLAALIQNLSMEAEAKLIDRETPFCEAFEIPSNNPNVQLIMNAANRVLGRNPEITYHEGPCDSCILVSEGRIPTIEFGPTGGKLHEPDEYVEIESVRKTTEVYMEILKTALG
jgi:acetylornithine deacetylase/succinyl-diaminopimelate desuccinylase family protein